MTPSSGADEVTPEEVGQSPSAPSSAAGKEGSGPASPRPVAKRASRPRRAKDSTTEAGSEERAIAKAAVKAQIALPSDEDVPPEPKKKSTVKEVLIFEEVHTLQANRELRRTYADKAYELASNCLQFWCFAVLLNAVVLAITGKVIMSDTLLIAITSGVTINVLAAFLGVIRGLFPSDTAKKKKKAKRRK